MSANLSEMDHKDDKIKKIGSEQKKLKYLYLINQISNINMNLQEKSYFLIHA